MSGQTDFKTCEVCGEESPNDGTGIWAVLEGPERWIHRGPCFLEYGLLTNARGEADVSHPTRSVGECATWIETAARQAILLEKQAEEIAALKLREKHLREKLEAMANTAAGMRSMAGTSEEFWTQDGRAEAYGDVLELLAEPRETRP